MPSIWKNGSCRKFPAAGRVSGRISAINGPVRHVVVIARPSHYGRFYEKIRPRPVMCESNEIAVSVGDGMGLVAEVGILVDVRVA